MRAVVQRVARASVTVEGEVVGEIGRGLGVLLGVGLSDTPDHARRLAAKVAALRVFDDADGRIDRDALAAGGAVLCISQFTLFADVRRGNRPSFDGAAPRPQAEPLYREFCESIEAAGLRCERGVFGAEMLVELVNDGPVTLTIDTDDLAAPRRA